MFRETFLILQKTITGFLKDSSEFERTFKGFPEGTPFSLSFQMHFYADPNMAMKIQKVKIFKINLENFVLISSALDIHVERIKARSLNPAYTVLTNLEKAWHYQSREIFKFKLGLLSCLCLFIFQVSLELSQYQLRGEWIYLNMVSYHCLFSYVKLAFHDNGTIQTGPWIRI